MPEVCRVMFCSKERVFSTDLGGFDYSFCQEHAGQLLIDLMKFFAITQAQLSKERK